MGFFLLNDTEQMLNAVRRVLPRNRGLAGQVWKEMNQQITNYIRGKVLEKIVVGIATALGFLLFALNYSLLGFLLFALNYSLLQAVLVGFSVLIPYIGAFVVTIPVVGVALFQFGAGTEFWSCGVLALWAELFAAAGGAGRLLGTYSVHWRICGDHSGGWRGAIPVWCWQGIMELLRGVSDYSGAGRQPVSTGVVLRSG